MSSTLTTDLVAINCLHSFLESQINFAAAGEDFTCDYLSALSLHDYISTYFHLYTEGILRGIVNEALKYRQSAESHTDANVLGRWGDIIDCMKVVLQERRDLASKHFQSLIQYGMKGDLHQVDKYLQLLFCQGYVDHLFEDVLDEAMKTFQQQNSEDNFYMMVYFKNTVEGMKREQNETGKWKVCSPLLRKCKLSMIKSAVATSTVEQKVPLQFETKNSPHDSISQTLPSYRDTPLPTADLNEDEIKELMAASDLLNSTVKECQGDVAKLQQILYQDIFILKKIAFAPFKRALQDNIDACEAAGYTNKLKLFRFLQDYLLKQEAALLSIDENNRNSANSESFVKESTSFMSTHHAPQFVDDRNAPVAVGSVRIAPQVMTFQSFLDAEKIGILNKPKNNKNKAEKKAARLKTQSLAEQVSDHLNEHGWAVVDNFIPLDVIRRLRIEFNLFRDHFEQSEIWVGKKADVGAHLRVPSVRGDKVLWMCGGHQILGNDLPDVNEDGNDGTVVSARKGSRLAPEGMSRLIKTHGEIEPCKLEVKAASPMRKFTALKDVVTATDKLVEELKGKNVKCKGIYERSDAMLAVYPGEGARFANHIDNTTQDGRRLTLLIYLNPGWTEEMGGALRVTESLQSAIDYDAEESANRNDVSSILQPIVDIPKQRAVDIYPMAGRLAMFYSSEIPHEVMPTYGDRFSLTVWYYDREERKQAIVRARDSGAAAQISRTSVESQQSAKTFIGDLMGGDDIGEDGGDPTEEELSILTDKVVNLSDEALDIVANITGAPSVQSFRQGFPMLTVQDLKSMRALFRRMGLQG